VSCTLEFCTEEALHFSWSLAGRNYEQYITNRVAQNARSVVKGVVKGVTRASFGRRAPLTPQLKRASTRRREEEVFRGVHMIQQVAAVHLGWGQALGMGK